MNIGFVLHQFLPGYNSGTEQYVYHLAKRFRQRGDEVKVFTFEPNTEGIPPYTEVRRDTFEDIPVTRFLGWMGHFPNIILSQYYNPFFGKLFADFLRDEKIELVHSFQNQRLTVSVIEESYLAGIPCVVNLMDFWYICPHIQLLRNNNTLCKGPYDYKECIHCQAPFDATFQSLYPYIYGEHTLPLDAESLYGVRAELLAGSDPYHRVAAAAMRPHLIRNTLALADRLISPSLFLQSVFVENGYDPDRFTLVRYGIDLEPLKTVSKQHGDVLRVGYIGTITAHKGLDTLVESIRMLDGEPRVSLEVHGDMNAFPEFASRVRKLAGHDERIHFHGRFESRDLPRVQSEMDVLVVPSIWYENTPFVILEALASGTPVIASDLGGLSELIDEGKNGLLFKPGDAADLRNKIDSLIKDRSLIEQFDTERAGVRSLDDNVDQFSGLYRELMTKAAAAPGSEKSEEEKPAGKERSMDPDVENLQKRNALLQQQTQHLTSQLFHLITMNSGLMKRLGELEGVMEDQVYLAEHSAAPDDQGIPSDLSPSIRKRLVQAKQIKSILHRRNDQIVELQRQIEAYRANAEFQGAKIKDQDETLKQITRQVEDRQDELRKWVADTERLNRELTRINRFLPIRIWKRLKKMLKGGTPG
ncbi:MAG: glycosyltransferase [Planctomycetota bacterium]